MSVRVGDTVYDDGKVIAIFTHGAWYKPVKRKRGPELEPCVATESRTYAELVDAATMPLTAGEKEVLATAEAILEDSQLWRDQKALVMGLIETGIMDGLKKYGPYNPAEEKRDLVEKVERMLRNVIVYASMYEVGVKPQNNKIRSAGISAARALASLNREKDF